MFGISGRTALATSAFAKRLACRALLAAGACAVRAGLLGAVFTGAAMGFALASTGTAARIPAGLEAVISGTVPEGGLDAHTIQPFYAGMLARDCALAIRFVLDGDTVTLTAA